MNLIELYDNHIARKNSIENYNMFIDDIIDDILMGKVTNVNNKVIIKGINEKVKETIKLFYKLAEDLRIPLGRSPVDWFRVYRQMNFEFKENTLLHPIPFSTCIESAFILDQPIYQGIKYIYVIDFLENTNIVSIFNENEGKEIILPACILLKTNTIIESDSVVYYYCKLINATYSYGDMENLINENNTEYSSNI